jgi:hypothetical protein
MHKYFYYDSESGFDTFETEQEAIETANKMIDEARQEAIYDGEWPEWVDSICYGKITGLSVADLQEDGESYEYSLKGQP